MHVGYSIDVFYYFWGKWPACLLFGRCRVFGREEYKTSTKYIVLFNIKCYKVEIIMLLGRLVLEMAEDDYTSN